MKRVLSPAIVMVMTMVACQFFSMTLSGCKSKNSNEPHVPDKNEVRQMLFQHYGKATNGMDNIYDLELYKSGDYIYTGDIEFLGDQHGKRSIRVYVQEEPPYTIRWDIGN